MKKMRIEERRVGARFMVAGFGDTRVVNASYEACSCCAFRHVACTELSELGPCTCRDRQDRKNVIFRLVNHK
ncbi:MAG: hypothetical protein K5778_04415 [Bacteroidaceae bacterium]|nr:hypothetical protein [Bacteroidaceae bacterium]MDO4994694.1 hypothetical protein [Bacteroidales bacterium]